MQGAEYLADAPGDITDEDAWGGAETDGNAAALRLVQQDLAAALGALTGGRGEYDQSPAPDPLPTDAQVQATLQTAQQAATGGG